MYVYFDVDERTALRMWRAAREGKAKRAADLPVAMGLADENGFPHQGQLAAMDNRVDPATGTLRCQAVFANPQGIGLPGMFARVRLPIGSPHRALLVPERVVGSREGQKDVLIVNEKNLVESRPVKLGQVHDGLREVQEGLTGGERIVLVPRAVSGGTTVRPKETTVPASPK